MLVDTLGHLLALRVTAANEQDRAEVGALAEQVQQVSGETVELVYLDQNYAGEQPAQDAAAQAIQLYVVKLPEAKKSLFCYRVGGSWNGLLVGRPVFAG